MLLRKALIYCAPSLSSLTQTTAGTPTAWMADGSVADCQGHVMPCGRRHELLLLWGPSFLHWVNTSHLSSQVESRWPAWGHALTCNQWYIPAPTLLLGWDVESRCWCGAPRGVQFFPLRHYFEGWCSTRCFGPHTAPIRCCRDSVFVIGMGVGASQDVPTFKRAWARPPGGPEDSLTDTEKDSRLPDSWNDQNISDHHSEFPIDLLPPNVSEWKVKTALLQGK